MSTLDHLWTEKYRPKNIEAVALPSILKNNISKWFEDKEIPHLLFYGPAGCGKTTTAFIICDNIIQGKDDVLIVNGSYQRSINDIRNSIYPFARNAPIHIANKIRIVLIDEADSMSSDAWKALRNIIESCAKYTRFILTCNYVAKIPSPIQSRMQMVEFKEYSINECIQIIYEILAAEDVLFNDDDVKVIVNKLYPDLRQIINTCQLLVVEQEDGTKHLKIDNLDQSLPSENVIVHTIISALKGTLPSRKAIVVIDSIIKKKWIDYQSLYTALFDAIPANNYAAKVLVNKYAYMHTTCISEDMNFLACVYELLTS